MNVTHITEAPGHLFGMITQDIDGKNIRFTVYQQHPTGETSIERTEPFAYQDQAIEVWSQWGADRAWPSDTPIGEARRLLDETQ